MFHMHCTPISVRDDGLYEHWSNTANPPPQRHVHGGREEGEVYCMGFRNQLWLVRSEVGVRLVGQREMCWRL